MAFNNVSAIEAALITCSWNCLEKAWNDLQSDSQKLSDLFQEPERKVEAITESLKRWKEHAGLLSWNLTIHSLSLRHTDPHSSRDLRAVVTCWKMVQLLVDQLEKVVVNQKGKTHEDLIWSQIQDLVKKLHSWLRRKRVELQNKEYYRDPKKEDPDNSSTNTVGQKRRRIAFDELNQASKIKRKSLPKLTIKIPKSTTDTYTVTRPKLQRQFARTGDLVPDTPKQLQQELEEYNKTLGY